MALDVEDMQMKNVALRIRMKKSVIRGTYTSPTFGWTNLIYAKAARRLIYSSDKSIVAPRSVVCLVI